MENFTSTYGNSAADAAPQERASFIRRTYLHLAGAILAFVGLEYLIFSSGFAETIAAAMVGTRFSWFIVLSLFMGVSYIANKWANSKTSKATQYFGFALSVSCCASLFVALLFIA